MNPLQKIRTIPLSGSVLRILGWCFLAGGALGQLMQTWLVNRAVAQGAALLELLEEAPGLMTLATCSMILTMLEYLAVPIFVFLMVEGAAHTKHFGKYFLRILALAAVCQIPYLIGGQGINPAFSAVLAMILLFFFRQFQKGVGSVLIRITAVLGCLLWGTLLGIPHGPACVVLAAALWLLKDKPYFRTFGGFAATILCCIFSPAYAAASLVFLLLHFYSGERGSDHRLLSYCIYPAILLLTMLAGSVL